MGRRGGRLRRLRRPGASLGPRANPRGCTASRVTAVLPRLTLTPTPLWPVLYYSATPCAALDCPVLNCSASLRPAVPCPALPCLAPPRPVPRHHILPCTALPCLSAVGLGRAIAALREVKGCDSVKISCDVSFL